MSAAALSSPANWIAAAASSIPSSKLLPSLPVKPPALDHVEKVRDHAGLYETLAVVIEIHSPGITAALGCGAATGIPMTHRDVAQAVTFITGHGEGELALDWRSLARTQHSLVIYMGVGSAGVIAAHLIEHGMNGGTQVAVIENGTAPNQKFVTGNLEDLAALIQRHEISAPAIIVIGDVVKQSNLQFASVGLGFKTETQPLFDTPHSPKGANKVSGSRG